MKMYVRNPQTGKTQDKNETERYLSFNSFKNNDNNDIFK